MTTLYGFAVFLFSMALRMPFWAAGGSDNYSHLRFVKIRKEKGLFFNYEVDNSLNPGYMAEPTLTHWIISFFPRKLWCLSGYALTAFYDSVVSVIVFTVIFMETQNLDHALIISMIYASTPLLAHVRLGVLGSRTFGYMMSTVYFLLLKNAIIDPKPQWIILGLLSLVIIILSSQFALQNVFFITILSSILLKNFFPIFLMVGGLFVSLACAQLHVDRFVKYKRDYLKWYFNNTEGTTAQGTNRLSDYRNLFKTFRGDFRSFYVMVYQKLTFLMLGYSAPLLFVIIFVLAFNLESRNILQVDSGAVIYFVYLISSVITFAIISYPKFSFLGEAERYLIYSTPFLTLIFARISYVENWPISVLLIFLLVHLSLYMVRYVLVNGGTYYKNLFLNYADHPLKNYLDKIDYPKKIMSIPFKDTFLLDYIVDNTNIKYYYLYFSDPKSGFDYMVHDSERFNVPRCDLEYYWDKYGIDTLIVNRSIVDSGGFSKKYSIQYNWGGYHLLNEYENYAVYIHGEVTQA